LREVMELRTLGFAVNVASINDCDRSGSDLTPAEQGEQQKCFYVKKAARGFPLDLLFTLGGNPLGLAKAIVFALGANGPNLTKSLKNLLYLAEAIVVAQWMRRSRLAHLHVHFATPAATVGMLVGKISPVGFSMTVHGPDEFYNIYDYILPGKCAQSRFLCAISDFAASQLMKMMPADQWGKIKVIPLGVDPEVFTPVSHHPAGKFFQLLCVGRLVPEKGQHILLDALCRLREAGRDVRLILAGDGPSRASLEAFAARRHIQSFVHFAGAINQDQIRAIYSQADAFVLASFAEGVPVVLMEAMAMEIPCIATWIAGIPELIRDGCHGLLIPPGNPLALAQAISRLMDEPALRCTLGKAGRRQVIEKYNLKNNVARLGRMFHEELPELAA